MTDTHLEPPVDEPGHDEEHGRPRGTALIVGAFLVVTAALWAWTYYLLVSWGR